MTLEEMYGNAKALVEDRTYNIGEISEKTGLQKTANGWVKPKSNKKESVKSEQINKTWSKSDVVKSVPNGWKKAEGVTTVPNGYVAITNGGSFYPKEGQTKRETKIIKEEDFKKGNNKGKANFDEYGLPDNATIAMKDKFLKKENVKDPDKLSNAEFNTLAKKLDSELGIGNMELAQELLVTSAENSTEKNKTTKAENPYALSKEEKNEAMKNPKTRLSQKYDEVIKSKKGTPQYNTALEEYTKERESYKNSQGVEALKEFPVVPISKDSACRITADTKIRLKK